MGERELPRYFLGFLRLFLVFPLAPLSIPLVSLGSPLYSLALPWYSLGSRACPREVKMREVKIWKVKIWESNIWEVRHWEVVVRSSRLYWEYWDIEKWQKSVPWKFPFLDPRFSGIKTGRVSEYRLSVLPESITYLYSLVSYNIR